MVRINWSWPAPLESPGVVARPAAEPVTVQERDDPIAVLLQELIDARQGELTIAEAVKLPAVRRGTDLIVSIASSFTPLAYGPDGRPLATQPTIVAQPDPGQLASEFVSDAVSSLLFDGDLVLQLLGPGMRVLPAGECEVQWDARRIKRRISWRGTDLADSNVRLVSIGRRPGELRGTSPLRSCLPYLAPIKAAEDYATAFFAAGGVPEVVLKVAAALTEAEADALKQRWVASRVGPDPAVLSGGIDPEFPAIDPQRAQMQEARAYGATVVSRILGIPASLLHVETSGATITYTNPAGAIEELVKATILPLYLRPLERVWSALAGVPVRFDTDELARVDVAGRAAIDAQLVGSGILTADDVRPRWQEAMT